MCRSMSTPAGGVTRIGGCPGDGLAELGPRAFDLRGLGARRLEFDRVGASRHRVRACGWSLSRPSDGGREHGAGLARLPERVGNGPHRGVPVPRARRRASARALLPPRAREDERTRSRGDGVAGANVVHIRDGKVTKLFAYFELERALADLGLSPEPDDPA